MLPIVQLRSLDLSKPNPTRNIVVVIPELVEDKWYEFFPPQSGRAAFWNGCCSPAEINASPR